MSLIDRASIKFQLARVFRVSWFNRSTGNHLPILCYHSVNGQPNAECDPMLPETFESHLVFLKSNFTIVSVRQISEWMAKGQPLPANAVALTFDDGYRDNFEEVFPLLEKHKAHATIYVVSGFIDGAFELITAPGWEAMNWEQVREMDASDYVEIGAHTDTHPILSALDDRAAAKEIQLSKSKIEKQLGHQVGLFAYPNGQGGDIPPIAVRTVLDLGFIGAVSTFWRTRHKPTQAFLVNRVMMDGADDVPTLKMKLAGGYDFIYYIHKLKAIFSVAFKRKGVWK